MKIRMQNAHKNVNKIDRLPSDSVVLLGLD